MQLQIIANEILFSLQLIVHKLHPISDEYSRQNRYFLQQFPYRFEKPGVGKKEFKQLAADKLVYAIITTINYFYLNILLCTRAVKLLFLTLFGLNI